MQDNEGADDGRPLATNRAVDILVALLLLGGCAIVIYDSARLGFSWREGEGPAPGYFPFFVAVILGISSPDQPGERGSRRGAGEIFVSARPRPRAGSIDTETVYVALIGGLSLGRHGAGARSMWRQPFPFAFMIVIGRETR